MSFLRGKYSILLSIALVLAGIATWQSPTARLMFGLLFLLFNVTRALASVLAKHLEAHRRGNITRLAVIRNVSIETTGLLLAMTLAGFLGRHIALIATTQISDGPIRLAAGIATGLLVGMAVGLVMHHTWGRLAGAQDRSPSQ